MNNSDPFKKQIELNSLIEYSQLINSSLDLEFILGNILLTIMGKMLITKGAVLLKKENNLFSINALKGLNQKYKNTDIQIDFPGLSIFNNDDFNGKENFLTENGFKYYFKIYFANKLLGVFCLGNKIKKDEIQNDEIIFIETMLNISAPAIENTIKFEEIKKLNNNLNTQVQQLESLFELGKEFNSNFQDKDNIIKLLNYTLLGNFGIRDLIIFIKSKTGKFNLLTPSRNFEIEEELLNKFEKIDKPYIIGENTKDKQFAYLIRKNFRLIIPVRKNHSTETIVCLGNKLNKSLFTSEDIQFIESILNLSTISIDNSFLFNEFLEKQKIDSELKIAREMQVALLPKQLPEIRNFDISAINIPALQVGGDYYDIIKLSDTKFAFVIADVSGKGTPASLLMSNIQSAIHSFLKLYDENTFNINTVTSKINELIYENTTVEKFITFFWGILDIEKNTFKYINAGHNPPLYYSNKKFELLNKGGLMLGVIEKGFEYETGEIFLDKDSVLALYTDGVTEALDINNEEFSENRLKGVIITNKNESAADILMNITSSIDLFTKGVNQYDDITLIILKHK